MKKIKMVASLFGLPNSEKKVIFKKKLDNVVWYHARIDTINSSTDATDTWYTYETQRDRY